MADEKDDSISQVDGTAAKNQQPHAPRVVTIEPVITDESDSDSSASYSLISLSELLTSSQEEVQSEAAIASSACDPQINISSCDTVTAQPSSDSGQFNTAREEKEDTPERYVPLAGENPLENSKGQEKIGNTGEGGAGGGDFSASCGQALSTTGSHSLSDVQRGPEEDGGETSAACERDKSELIQESVCKRKREDSPCDSIDAEVTDLKEDQDEDGCQLNSKPDDDGPNLNSCDEVDKGLFQSAQMSHFWNACFSGKSKSSQSKKANKSKECLTRSSETAVKASRTQFRDRGRSRSDEVGMGGDISYMSPEGAQQEMGNFASSLCQKAGSLWSGELDEGIKIIPLPKDIIQYMQLHLIKVQNVFRNKKLEIDVNIVRYEELDALEVKCMNGNSDKAQNILNGILAKLYQKQLKIKPAVESYLQSPEGKKWLAEVQRSSDCCVQLQVTRPVLLTAQSHQGHRLLVCGGPITADDRDTQVLVLPLCEESPAAADGSPMYKDWTPEYKHILNAELMSPDPAMYVDILNQQKSRTLMLKCPRPSVSRYITLMKVPAASSNKFKDHLAEAVLEAVKTAVDRHSDMQNLCIALPLGLGLTDKDWKAILVAVCEAQSKLEGRTKVTLKLYTGHEVSEQLVLDVKRYLSGTYDVWTTDTQRFRGTRITVRVGDILESDMLSLTEVLVNSTDEDLKHTNGLVSKPMLHKAGGGLAAECKKSYPQGLKDGHLVAVTDSYGLRPVKKIFHIALPKVPWTEQEGEGLLEELRARVLACLTLACANGYRSITFPALGTGKLEYPPDRVAQTMFSAAQDFFEDMPRSSLQDVYVVCFHEDKQSIHEFEEQEAFGYQPGEGDMEGGRPSKMTTGPAVRLCGKKAAVETAVKEIQRKKPSLNYERAASETGSFVDEDEHVEAEAASAETGGAVGGSGGRKGKKKKGRALAPPKHSPPGEAGSKGLNLWSVSMPLRDFEKLGVQKELAAKKTFEVIHQMETEQEPVPCKRLWFKQENGGIVMNIIQAVISDSDHDAAQNPPRVKQDARRTAQDTTRVAQGNAEPNWTKVIDQHEFLALSVLIGREFHDMFTVNGLPDDQREIVYNGSSPPQVMLEKMDSLRHEELPFSKDECFRLGQPFDTKSEGVDAFIIPEHNKGKVLILSLEYSALAKAKHIINIRLGKLKVTSRSNRRFESDHSEQSKSQASQPPPVSRRASANTATGPKVDPIDYVTKSGLQVSVYKTDITKLPVDAIVNAANGHLQHGGGVAYAISWAAGFNLEDECAEHITRHGPLKVTEVVVTTGGQLPCSKVLHAVGPRWIDYEDKSACQRDLSDTVLNCLKTAHQHGCKTLAVSSISSAIFGVPQDLCAECYLSAVQKFDDQFGGTTSLTQVHFVDVNDAMISTIQKTFTEKWNAGMMSPDTQQTYSPVHRTAVVQAPEAQRGTREPGLHSAPGNVSETVTRKSREVCHVHTQGLDVSFQQQSILSTQTESIVLWQGDKLFQDPDSQQIISREGARFSSDTVPTLKMQLQSVSAVSHWHGSQLFICHKISPGALGSSDLYAVLGKADAERVTSVAVPAFPQVLGSKKDAQGFGESLQKAVSGYLKWPERYIKEIRIISSDEQNLKAAGETFENIMHAALEDSTEQTRTNERVTRSSSRQQHGDSKCIICHRTSKDAWGLTKCGHMFCRECLEKQFRTGRVRSCPECQTSYDYTGNQLGRGQMKMKSDNSLHLSGFPDNDTLVIEYNIPKGKMKEGDPEPAQPYEGVKKSAYLPNSREGRKVLMLLKNAFDRGLTFHLEYSDASCRYVLVSNIPHKTDPSHDCDARFGYPDPGYLLVVQGKLLEYGIGEGGFTAQQKAFVDDPNTFLGRNMAEFSHHFKDTPRASTTV